MMATSRESQLRSKFGGASARSRQAASGCGVPLLRRVSSEDALPIVTRRGANASSSTEAEFRCPPGSLPMRQRLSAHGWRGSSVSS